MRTVLIVGLGDLGGWALELLARSEGVDRLVTVRRSGSNGVSRTDLAAIGSVFQGHAKEFEEVRHDVSDVDGTARLLEKIRPDIILNTTTTQSPRVLMTADLSLEAREQLRRARFSMWLPWHLLPVTWLTEALLKTGLHTHLVNLAFPDVVNPALWKHFEWGPVAGGGNLEIATAAIIRYVSKDRRVPLEDVSLAMIGSHAFFSLGPQADLPYFLQIQVGETDVTSAYGIEGLMRECVHLDWHRTHVFSAFAASAVKNVLGILRDSHENTHVTAPNGLPGVYPARLSQEGVEITLPKGVALEDAIAINVAGNRFDGIAAIERDGTVVYTDDSYEAMLELGYDCRELTFDSLPSRAAELKTVFRGIVTPASQGEGHAAIR